MSVIYPEIWRASKRTSQMFRDEFLSLKQELREVRRALAAKRRGRLVLVPTTPRQNINTDTQPSGH